MAPSDGRGSAPYPEIRPMLATPGPLPGGGEDAAWAFETKWDGARCVVGTPGDGTVRLVTRAGGDATATYPELGALGEQLRGRPRCWTVRSWSWTPGGTPTSGCCSAGWAW